MDGDRPLVSVGVPTYNRAEQLRAALISITAQTYRNLEIIVSDNASEDHAVAAVAVEFSRKDDRVRYVRQRKNIGSMANFAYVLESARGDYFMWAADDDAREPWFVERCLGLLSQYPDVAAASAEVQYTCNGRPMPFFPQAAAFHDHVPRDVEARLCHIIDNNVDNLVYALFRHDSLMRENRFFWQESGMNSSNEIPVLLYAAYRGGFVVFQNPGFLKSVSEETYHYIRWEFCGGQIPQHARIRNFETARGHLQYHRSAGAEIYRAIELLPLTVDVAKRLKRRARRMLWLHYVQMLMGRKHARPSVPLEYHA